METPDTHDEFTIRWKASTQMYHVSTPNLEEMRVIPKARLTALRSRLEERLRELERARDNFPLGGDDGDYAEICGRYEECKVILDIVKLGDPQ